MHFPRIRPMGDAALLIELGETLDLALNARVHALARRIEPMGGEITCVPGYATLLVEFDPMRLEVGTLESEIRRALETLVVESNKTSLRLVEIPVRYGGEYGPDLEFVAQHNRLTPEQVIRIHCSVIYQVFMLGFTPGFPYMGIVPAEIAVPRRDTPRPRVPAGSVGIAGRQTGIYPRESPGGWQLIGRTEVKLFDPAQDPPALLWPGDRVRFVAQPPVSNDAANP